MVSGGISLTALTCTLLLGFLAVIVVLVPPLHRGRAQDVPNEEREALARNRGRRPDPGRRREARLVAQGGGIARRVSAPADEVAANENGLSRPESEGSETVADVAGGIENAGLQPCGHGYLSGTGCYLCDPNHPYKLKEGVKA